MLNHSFNRESAIASQPVRRLTQLKTRATPPAQVASRLRPAWRLLLLALAASAAVLPGCDNPNAIVVSIRPPAGVAISQYALTVQDRESRSIVYQSGIQPVDAVTMGRDLNAQPLRVGLKLTKSGQFLIHVRASTGMLARDGALNADRTSEWFFAGMVAATSVIELDAPLLEVAPDMDQDFDHFPDAVTWPAALPDAQAQYQGHPELLDCVDRDPASGDPPLPVPYYASQINPLAKPVCGLAIDLACEAASPVCKDVDGDGDPENTDCDDSDAKRFHGNPRPRNCCQCTDRKSCATNHAKLADQASCQPARCDNPFDFDCSGQVVPCFVDDDCDGFSPNDPIVSLRDCDDTNPDVHPGAPKNCADSSHDWACDGSPTAGCVACDLDGDGFQRTDAANGCPTTGYAKPVDCNDNDRGVFPGSSSFEGVTPLFRDLKGNEGGGSKAAALRGLCANKAPGFPTPQTSLVDQDSDCDGNARNGCPSTACDGDHDGFPNGTAGCNPGGLPQDCDDTDAKTFPGAPDDCSVNKVQNCVSHTPCNMLTVPDKDGDGYSSDYDCDDNNKNVHPWAAESCNGVDDDCDGLVDEGNPDQSGAQLVKDYTVGGSTYKSITSCADDTDGLCGQKNPQGAFSGRCVCSGIAPTGVVDGANHSFCPGNATGTQLGAKCFGANQPALQTCKASTVTDEDCDGRTDAPDGARLVEAGSACGVTTGTCLAGTVKGCDRTKSNPFYMPATGAVSPAFDPERRFLTCNTDATAPTAEICDTKDNNCNAMTDEACTELSGAGNPHCCPISMVPTCKDFSKDFNFCGSCTKQCSSITANVCTGGVCKCGGNNACAGAKPVCSGGTCVQCSTADASACVGATPACNTTTKTCVQCTAANATACTGATPVCDVATNKCVQCTAADATACSGATPACNTTTNQCVQCTAANATACTGTTPVCNTATNTCVGCLVGTDCPTATPVCLAATKTCVQCDTGMTAACTGATPICNTATKACIQCDTGMTAACSGATPVCNTTTKMCVACLTNAQCTTAASSKCNAATNVCMECAAAADCTQISGKPNCKAGSGCVECLDSAGCATTAKPICDAATYACRTCGTDLECSGKSATKPYCGTSGVCGTCKASATDCLTATTPICNPVTAACKACSSDTECATDYAATPFCPAGAAGKCTECKVSTDCAGMMTPICDAATFACRACATDPECVSRNGAGSTCNTANGKCS